MPTLTVSWRWHLRQLIKKTFLLNRLAKADLKRKEKNISAHASELSPRSSISNLSAVDVSSSRSPQASLSFSGAVGDRRMVRGVSLNESLLEQTLNPSFPTNNQNLNDFSITIYDEENSKIHSEIIPDLKPAFPKRRETSEIGKNGVLNPQMEISHFYTEISPSSSLTCLISEIKNIKAVSYTHLTLPTILLVQISVVAVSLKKKKKTHLQTNTNQKQS
eukprot:TRINITY_DN27335_c0_g1_i4.p2 TRINITY_DN27335_c0_g1~~TRINITY_DN27335_c0_g1_i4.p2  ORF type:complete len:219 (-),score=44.61 TRINITY_DN27335_c0_g1_i4:44-700(-)